MNDIYTYFKKNIKSINFIEKKSGIHINIVIYIMTLIEGIASVFLIYYAVVDRTLMILELAVAMFVTFFAFALYINSLMKKAAFKITEIKSTKFEWANDKILHEIRLLKVAEFESYLIEERITHKRLNSIIKEIEKYINEYKPRFPVIPSFFAVIITIFIEKLFSEYLRIASIKNIDQLTYHFSLVGVILIGLSLMYFSMYFLYRILIKDALESQYNNYRELLGVLKEVDISQEKQYYRSFE